MIEKMFDVDGLKQELEVSRTTIYRWAKLGMLPKSVTMPGKGMCWHEDVIEAWMRGKVLLDNRQSVG